MKWLIWVVVSNSMRMDRMKVWLVVVDMVVGLEWI